MNNVMQQVPDTDPRMIAWNAYKATEDFANSVKWARTQPSDPAKVPENANPHTEEMCIRYTEGSLWAAFLVGWEAGRKDKELLT